MATWLNNVIVSSVANVWTVTSLSTDNNAVRGSFSETAEWPRTGFYEILPSMLKTATYAVNTVLHTNASNVCLLAN